MSDNFLRAYVTLFEFHQSYTKLHETTLHITLTQLC